jgi:hypothetical protein
VGVKYGANLGVSATLFGVGIHGELDYGSIYFGTNDITISQGASIGASLGGNSIFGCQAGGSWGRDAFEEKGGCGAKVERGWSLEEEIASSRGIKVGFSAIVGFQFSINPADYNRCMLSP